MINDIIFNTRLGDKMNNYLQGLNKEQYKAVTTSSQYARVIAGAGSGKTRVLITRIAYLINDLGIDPKSILAITFTNKAANEMKQRIEKMLGSDGLGAHISTIHSFCVSVLRVEISKEGYPSNFTILDSDDQKSVIKEGMKLLEFDSKEVNVNQVLDYIGGNKGAGISPEVAKEKAYSIVFERYAKLYEYYQNRLHELYALDFDDLLLWTNMIFKKYPKTREKWQKKFGYILVDEFQDIDNVQYELLQLLSNPNTYIYVVGDPDQTIYSWRGANVNIIMDFEKEFKPNETIILNQNYRSTKTILNAANSLIANNKHRVKKDLFTDNQDGSTIEFYSAVNEEAESRRVVEKIMMLTRSDYQYKDCAVLYRSNYLSRAVEKLLMDYKIPYIIYGGIRFYERAEIKDMLSYLRMITNNDDLSFKRVINSPKRGIGNKTMDDLFAHSRLNGVCLYDGVDSFECSKKAKNTLTDFKKMVEDWKTRSQFMTLEEIFQMVFEESSYRVTLETSIDPKDEERLENVKELLNDIIAYNLRYPEATLNDYLSEIALYTDKQSTNEGNCVSLMTVHAAKGLEFKNVFVVGLSEGIFPSEKATREGGLHALEEERRLAYVAYTRAQDNLYLSDNRGYSYTVQMEKETSRFVDEIDEQYIERFGIGAPIKQAAVTSNTGAFSLGSASKKTTKYRVNDIVVHEAFGEGKIIAIDGQFGLIAFPYPTMTKKVALSFPKMHKKEN